MKNTWVIQSQITWSGRRWGRRIAYTGRDRILDFQRGFDSVDLTYYNATWAEVRGALRMSGGIVQLDLAKLGGYGLVDFVTEKRLALFTADDFIL